MIQGYKPNLYCESDEVPETLGPRLRKYIQDSGTTQEDFALQIGIEPAALSRWINGRKTPNTTSLYRICLLTGLSADYLLGLEGDHGKDITE